MCVVSVLRLLIALGWSWARVIASARAKVIARVRVIGTAITRSRTREY